MLVWKWRKFACDGDFSTSSICGAHAAWLSRLCEVFPAAELLEEAVKIAQKMAQFSSPWASSDVDSFTFRPGVWYFPTEGCPCVCSSDLNQVRTLVDHFDKKPAQLALQGPSWPWTRRPWTRRSRQLSHRAFALKGACSTRPLGSLIELKAWTRFLRSVRRSSRIHDRACPVQMNHNNIHSPSLRCADEGWMVHFQGWSRIATAISRRLSETFGFCDFHFFFDPHTKSTRKANLKQINFRSCKKMERECMDQKKWQFLAFGNCRQVDFS